jgi:tRNA-splicing ligase RtcB (3'-phosphate/5'-hydroxy nucleic acid ligase)
MKEVNTGKNLIKLWLDDIEDGAMEQIKNIANLSFVYQWVAVMPDSHQGYGMPIGGVVALKNIISPNMVGVDIGCGMCAVNTHIKASEVTQEQLKEILGEVRKVVPVGFAHHQKKQDESLMPFSNSKRANGLIVSQEYSNALTQIGTLGGGNHFIELQKSDNDEMWIMIHSGSRNLGKKVCDYYNAKAVELAKKWHIPNVVEQELAYLPTDTKEGQDYIQEMQYCVDFAFANRKLMMDRICEVVNRVMKPTQEFEAMINIAHNYARLENHMGRNVWVHRKGATSAKLREVGIIPGSMGTKSYITEGLGNVQSFMSCSHGAGRKMGRMDASRRITLEEADKAMEGIVYGRWGKDRKGNLDFGEAPQAYKDIDIVMENQKDLTKILVELRPMAVIKGD